MLRKALFVIALAGLACGGQETTPSTTDTGATGGSARSKRKRRRSPRCSRPVPNGAGAVR